MRSVFSLAPTSPFSSWTWGRKTDVNDATWIADLTAFGLIKASFVPEEKIQEPRSLMRARMQPVREQTRHIQRIQR